jgi:hypothetical protein
VRQWLAIIVFLLSPLAAMAEEQRATVALTGLEGRKAILTLSDLKALPRVKVSVGIHGAAHLFEGALLSDVLAKIGAPAGKAIRGAELLDVIVVEARDGYKIALDLASADPQMRANCVILADEMDGAALDAEKGPFHLAVEGDLRAARAVHAVSAIRLIRVD